jgi:hypothetical protein
VAHRRLRDSDALGGTRHVLFARQRIEGNEQIEVDACEPFGQAASESTPCGGVEPA